MTKHIYLMGVYPPPYGGVTVKCKLFANLMERKGIKVTEIDFYGIKRKKKKIPVEIARWMRAFSSGDPAVYCVDTKRLRMVMMIQKLFPESIKNTIVLAPGGTFDKRVASDRMLCESLKKAKGIWVETDGLKKSLVAIGFNNVSVFPNPKSEKGSCAPRVSSSEQPLRLVFFSQISKEKGLIDIMEMTKILKERKVKFILDFFGHISSDVQTQFDSFVEENKNITYCGVFDSTKSSVYEKLNSYDLLLFPTHWTTEGVPGILVEAKMAGIGVIASNHSFNTEIIREDQNEGLIVREDYPREMADLVCRCAEDRAFVNQLKEGSFRSRKRYSLEENEAMIESI